MCGILTVNKTFHKFTNGGFAEALQVGKANPYLEYESIPSRAKHYPFHDGNSTM